MIPGAKSYVQECIRTERRLIPSNSFTHRKYMNANFEDTVFIEVIVNVWALLTIKKKKKKKKNGAG